jgi:hypothetical protein
MLDARPNVELFRLSVAEIKGGVAVEVQVSVFATTLGLEVPSRACSVRWCGVYVPVLRDCAREVLAVAPILCGELEAAYESARVTACKLCLLPGAF